MDDSADSPTDVATLPRGRRDGWVWYSLLPLGLGAWATIVAGIRCGVRQWIALGLFWTLTAMAGWGLWLGFSIGHGGGRAPAAVGFGVLLMFVAWIGGLAMAFSIRSDYERLRAAYRAPRAPWPTPTVRARTWTARYGLIAFVVTLASVIGIDLLLRHVIDVHIAVGPGVLIVDGMLLLTLLPLARRRGLSPRDLGLRRTPVTRATGLAILVFITYIVLTVVYALVFIGVSTRHSANVVSQTNHGLGTFETVLTIFAIGVSAPVVEEIFFRGLLYRSLRNRLPVFWAALLAGGLFGLAHIGGYPLITLPIKALFGVLACLLYERTGSILPGIAVHSLVDASAVDVALTGNDDVVLIVFGTALLTIFVRWVLLGWLRADTPTPYLHPQSPAPAGLND